jgi:hypothetical protein
VVCGNPAQPRGTIFDLDGYFPWPQKLKRGYPAECYEEVRDCVLEIDGYRP